MTFRLKLESGEAVSAIWDGPARPWSVMTLAHGAGAGMTHKGMAALAAGLAERGVAVLRYQFPYMEAGRRRPDPPALAQRTVRAAVAEAKRRTALPLFAGGRSFGARMTSQADALAPLGVQGLVFFAFPLHPAGKPGVTRATHLAEVRAPMLFVQGEADPLAALALLRDVAGGLPGATLHTEPFADHSFHAPARSGRKDGDIFQSILDAATVWMRARIE